jgi:hypothetical protein
MSTLNITGLGGAGTHTLRKTNVNLDENYVYFPGRSPETTRPADLANNSAYVVRETTGDLIGIDSNQVYFIQSDNFSVAFAEEPDGQPVDITGFNSGSVVFDYPFVLNNSFNISNVRFKDIQAVRYLTNSAPILGLESNEIYYVKNLSSGLGGSVSYQFTSHTFTTCGQTGQQGPTLTNLRATYNSEPWMSTFINIGNFRGYQDWVVPETGVYEFTVKGAPGRQGNALGGGGAIIKGRVVLQKDEIITIAVGQRGELPPNNTSWPASSGGTFVVRKNGNIPLFVAGGGSASSGGTNGFSAVTNSTFGGTSQRGFIGGANGNGAGGVNAGGAGGGFFSAGGNSSVGGGGGGFNNGLVGGFRGGTSSANGGFGGGGGSDGQSWGGPGGAGGYGGGATNDAVGSQSGGGGGSFIFSTATDVATSNGLFNGANTFNGVPITNLNTFNSGAAEGEVSVELVERSVFGFELFFSAEDAAGEIDPIAVEPAGSAFHALIPVTYDTVGDKISFSLPHGYVAGDAVTYTFTGTAAGGIQNTPILYVNVIDAYTIRLSTTPGPGFNTINLTSPSAATNERFGIVIVNTDTNEIKIPNHGFLVDQPIRYSSGGGVPIFPLQNGATYFVKQVVDENRITLSQSLQGPTLNLTTSGTGTRHSFILNILNQDEDSIFIPSHGYVSGQTVRYQKADDLVVTSIFSSGTSRHINTATNHNLIAGNRITFDGFIRDSIPAPQIVITQFASSGQTRTLTTAETHNLFTGAFVEITGFTGDNAARFNGVYIVTGIPTTNQINYTAVQSVNITNQNTNVTSTILQRKPEFEYLEHTRKLDIISISSSGTTRTITTRTPHYYSTGSVVFISGINLEIPGIQGNIGEYFNGAYLINGVPNLNTFTYIGEHEEPSRTLNNNISFGTTNLTPFAEVYREIILDLIPSATQIRYQMPSSSFSTSTETAVRSRVSRTGSRLTNRELINTTTGRLNFNARHGLIAGDRFTVASMSGNNQDVFNGEYRVRNVLSETQFDYTPVLSPKPIRALSLSGNTNAIVEMQNPHNLVNGNWVYLDDISGNDNDFWNMRMVINGVASEGTSRTLYMENANQMFNGQRFRITEMSEFAEFFVGEWVCTGVPDNSRITFTGVGNAIIGINLTVTGTGYRSVQISTVPEFSITSRFKTGNIADIQLNTTHGLEPGDTIRINNISGANPELFNGEHVVTSIPSTSRVTFVTQNTTSVASAGVSGTLRAVNQIRYGLPTYNVVSVTERELISHTLARYSTNFDHRLEQGSTVTVSGMTGNNTGIFNGTFVVASTPTARVFTVVRPPAVNVTTFTVSSRFRTLNVADVTFNTTHNLQIGNTITITNMSGTSGSEFNGTHVITGIPATNRVTFTTANSSNIANEAASGNITVDAVQSASSGGTITLNTIPRRNLTSGTTTLREVSSAGFTGELISNTAIPGLENQRIYFVQRVDANTVKLFTEKTLSNPVDIKGVGIGAHSIVTFSVDYEEDTITIPNHGFTLGELVEYDTVGNTEIAGLSSGTPYYIIPIDGNTFRLATSNNNAENGIFIDLTPTPSPTGRHKLKSLIKTPDGTYVISDVLDANTFIVPAAGAVPEIVKTFSPRSSLDATLNHIKVASHGFITGTKVTYSDGNETPIGGLTSDTDYFVIVINKDYIRLAETAEDAKSGNAISLTTFGAGLSHTLTSTQINGQIVGTGTLTTEAGSALVDGSGTSFSKILKVGDQLRIFPPDQEIPSFFAASDVNTSTETITLASHPFETGDAVVFNPGSGGPIRGIHQIASSGQTRTIRTREAHGYTTNQTVTISGLSSVGKSDFEGTFTITGTPDVFQFTYTASTSITLAFEVQTSGTAQTAGAAGSAPSPLVPGNYFFIRSLPNTSTFSINNRNRTDNILDFTTTVNHNLRAGNTFTVSNISGVNPEVFNGTFVVAHIPAANRVQARATVTGTNLGAVAVTGDLTPLSSNSVTVHNTRQDAIDGTTEIDLASQGSGFALKFSKIVPVGPIVREISAIGSDTQVTVSRPYNTTFTDIAYSYPTFVYVRPQGYSLHRPFDGGVEMSTGFGTWYGSIIRQTRKYFRYQSGKGLQTSAGINFKPSIDIEAMTRVGTSNSIAIRTRRPHGLVNGLVIRVDEAKDSFGIDSTVYNGEFQVTVIDSFNMTVISDEPVIQPKSYGFPRLHVTAWTNGALRSGMFDDQNGMFYEFDGEKLYAVRRSSTQQIAGTCAALRGSQFVFGTNTNFTSQLVPGDFIVLRGQSYKVASIENDTQITIKPEFKGSSGTEVEFNPGNGATGVVRVDTETFNLINHGFTNGIPVVYNSIDGQPIGGLRTGVTYYVDRIDSNNFRLKTSPGAAGIVNLSSAGTGDVHSFTPAKTGIIATLTEDTRIPQEDWSIDPCDGTGPTGYNLDLSKIQMIYIDYSWYGAGKIRFGFKTISGQVQYVHEFVHNNIKYESYFRSGNLPARYEVVTYDNPTYIPSLFHWGTSVIMDGTFDDDRAYLFTKSSPSLNIGGTTAKTFGSSAVNFRDEIINVPSHGFANGDEVQFLGTSSNGQPQVNTQNPATQVIAGQNEFPNLTNEQTYIVRIIDTNNIILYRNKALASVAPVGITSRSKSSWRVTINTVAAHGYAPGDFVWTYLPGDSQGPSFNGVFQVITVPSATQYTYDAFVGNFNVGSSNAPPGSVTARGVINITSQGNSQATYTLTPAGTLNNTSGSNYQPLISLRLSPSVSEGLTGGLGDRDVINRMQLRLQEIGVQTNQLIDVKLLLNGRLNNLNFQPVDSPSLVQVIEHTSNDTISGGIQVYNFKANGLNGAEQSTNVDVDELFELSNSILGGNSVFPDGPDIVTIAVARLTGQATLASAKMSWAEAQA